ncbi:GntR family transcriptional regulator [Parasalinivibrio latis]|uniref:GntR family transcriptional regulator n=1 Tax=Parasalinivibrio latis TaxID=2952610 RepID=UPI0030E5833B
MELSIHSQDPTPKYLQLASQLQRRMISAELAPGQSLPSVRYLARNLGINPMTVSRCYQMLVETGWLERRRGIGMVVARDGARERWKQRNSCISPSIHSLIAEAKELGMGRSELLALVMGEWEE